MNVEITDNSKEVSGAIHQVGQAIADTGSLLQTWESLQQGHWHRTVAVLYPGRFLRALRAFCVRGNFSSKAAGMRPALRLRRKSLSHLLPGGLVLLLGVDTGTVLVESTSDIVTFESFPC